MIAFDLQAVQSVGNSERGIARFVTEVVRHLLAGPHADAVDLFLWNDRLPRGDKLDRLGVGDRLKSFSDVAGMEIDVLHVNSPFELPAVTDLLPPVRARRLVTTCYDLIPYLFPDHYLSDPQASAAYRRRLGLIATSDMVVTDSQSAADDVTAYLGVPQRKVRVIGAGVASEFRPPDTPLDQRIGALREEWPDLRARYVLVPTAADWRKNSRGAIDAFAALPTEVRDRHQLVLFCRLTDGQRAELEAYADAAGVGPQVLLTGFVPDDLLITLYQSAELVFFPTIYEGFGLPVLEARRCGARVICSNSSSLPEVLPSEEARFNPHDPASISGTLERALTDVGFAVDLAGVPDPGFSWDRAVDQMIDAYRHVVGAIDRSSHSTPTRGRIAVVAGVLPAPTGEAEAVRDRLVAPLVADGRFDVTLYQVLHHSAALNDSPCQVRIFPQLAIDWQRGRLDEIVYVFGAEPSRLLVASCHTMPGHAVVLEGGSSPFPDDRMRSVTRFDDGDDVLGELTSRWSTSVAPVSI